MPLVRYGLALFVLVSASLSCAEGVSPVLAADLLVKYEECAAGVPGFASEHESFLRQWESRNGAIMSALEQDSRFVVRKREAAARARANQPSPRDVDVAREECIQLVVPFIGGPSIVEGASTPELALERFSGALRRGDTASALAFVDVEHRDTFRRSFAGLKEQEIAGLAARITKFELKGSERAVARVKTDSGDEGSVELVRSGTTGQWFISAM